MTEEIFAIAKVLVTPSLEEETVLQRLCVGAEQELRSALRPGVTAEDCSDLFLCAAAWLAAANLAGGRCGTGTVRVGDVSVGGGDWDGAARRMRQQAWKIMAPYCGGDGFTFVGVPG